MADEEGELTDALTGAVPTWRLDEEPIYLETVRDKGIPGSPTAPQGDVIKSEVVISIAADDSAFQEVIAELADPSEEKVLTPKTPPKKRPAPKKVASGRTPSN